MDFYRFGHNRWNSGAHKTKQNETHCFSRPCSKLGKFLFDEVKDPDQAFCIYFNNLYLIARKYTPNWESNEQTPEQVKTSPIILTLIKESLNKM